MNKFSNTNYNDDEEIDEDIKYEPKFDEVDDEDSQDDFIESIIEKHTDDYKFDMFIEKLQEITIEEEFEILKDEFFDKYCHEFEDKEENKFIYMEIFKKYTQTIERYIENQIKERLPMCKIEDFYKLLKTRKNEIDEQIYDMLLSFTDFQIFKEMMLDYKKSTNLCDFGFGIEKADIKRHLQDEEKEINLADFVKKKNFN